MSSKRLADKLKEDCDDAGEDDDMSSELSVADEVERGDDN